MWTDFPDVGQAIYLLNAALKMRLGRSGEKGFLFPQSWSDVTAFAEKVCGFTEPHEYEILMKMSEAYCVELDAAKEPLRKAPVRRYREQNVKH